MKKILSSLLSLALTLCLLVLPLAPAASADTNDGTPVTRSNFTFQINLHADGFPSDGAAHYADWENFLSKLSLSGTADAQSFLSPYSRVYFDGALCLNGESKLPFVYDGYYSYRYLRSPALRGEHLHFQMFNFFQFMLKGYYYMGLPTNLIALPLYPEAAIELLNTYWGYFYWGAAGEGSRTVPYETMAEITDALSQIAAEDTNDKLYYFLTCLLNDLGLTETVQERLCYLTDWLDYLDPDQLGMQIEVDGECQRWTLGETDVFTLDETSFSLYLPDDMGYVYAFTCTRSEDALYAQCTLTLEEEELVDLTIDVSGLLTEGALETQGHAVLDLTGSALYQDFTPLAFDFQCTRSAETLPCAFTLNVDWLHPQTGLPAVGYTYRADLQEMPAETVYDLYYDHQDDFFHLNESFMAEYRERYLPTIALSLVPFALEMPAGVISDTYAFAQETGILAFFGIE